MEWPPWLRFRPDDEPSSEGAEGPDDVPFALGVFGDEAVRKPRLVPEVGRGQVC